jgi:sporulation protein YqfC
MFVMGRKIRLKKKIIEALDLPMETALDVPRLTILGTERVLVENHKGIYEYYESFVRLQTGSGILKVGGEDLAIEELSAERLLVSGKIASVEYENKV